MKKQSAVHRLRSRNEVPPLPFRPAKQRPQRPFAARRWTAVVVLLLACWLPALAAAGPIRIVCDGAVEDSVRRLLASPDARGRGVSATVLPSMEPADAANALINGNIDVLVIATPLALPEDAPPLLATEWVHTPLVFAAHEQVPVNNLKLDEMVALLAGWVTRWPDGTPVRLLLPPPASRDLHEVKSASSGLAFAIDRALKRPGLTVVRSDEDLADRLEAVPGSIGFTTLGYLMSNERHLKALLIDGVEPSLANERLGLYRLQRIVSIVRRGEPSRPVAALVDFLLADRHHALLIERGLTPSSAPVALGD